MNKKIIDVYVMRDALKAAVSFVQGTDAVPLVFMFRDYTIPDGAKASVMVKKPSGKEVQDFAVINFLENSVEVDVSAQMVAEAGTSEMMLELKPGERTVFTFSQPITVEKNSTQVESDTGSTIVDKYLDDILEATERATTVTDDIEQKALNGDYTASITIQETITGEPGSLAKIENTGTEKDKNLIFTIPQGPQGESGVMVPTNGMFALYLDPATAHLHATYTDGSTPPPLRYDDENGHLYFGESEAT